MVYSGDLYWTGIYSEHLAGGGLGLVFTGAKTSLATWDTNTFYADHFGNGGSSRMDDITADASGTYWLRTDGATSQSTVSRAPPGIFVGQTVAQGAYGDQLFADPTGLYVKDYGGAMIERLDKRSGANSLVVEGDVPQGTRFALDSGNIYWWGRQCTSPSPGGCLAYTSTLYRAPTSSTTNGTALVTLAGNVTAIGFAFDATCVYWTSWTNGSDGTVAKFAK
jgi:hypothetical protein